MIEYKQAPLYMVWLLILRGGYCTQRRQVLVPGSRLLIKPLSYQLSLVTTTLWIKQPHQGCGWYLSSSVLNIPTYRRGPFFKDDFLLTHWLLGVPHWRVKLSGVRQSKILSLASLGVNGSLMSNENLFFHSFKQNWRRYQQTKKSL